MMIVLSDVLPVRRDRRKPPRAQKVKHHRADGDQDQYERYNHPLFIPALEGRG